MEKYGSTIVSKIKAIVRSSWIALLIEINADAAIADSAAACAKSYTYGCWPIDLTARVPGDSS